MNPVNAPSGSPSNSPSSSPSDVPSLNPSYSPTDSPTLNPSLSPVDVPSDSPSRVPTESPTGSPNDAPTLSPTAPSEAPSISPTTEEEWRLLNGGGGGGGGGTDAVGISLGVIFSVICIGLGVAGYFYGYPRYKKYQEEKMRNAKNAWENADRKQIQLTAHTVGPTSPVSTDTNNQNVTVRAVGGTIVARSASEAARMGLGSLSFSLSLSPSLPPHTQNLCTSTGIQRDSSSSEGEGNRQHGQTVVAAAAGDYLPDDYLEDSQETEGEGGGGDDSRDESDEKAEIYVTPGGPGDEDDINLDESDDDNTSSESEDLDQLRAAIAQASGGASVGGHSPYGIAPANFSPNQNVVVRENRGLTEAFRSGLDTGMNIQNAEMDAVVFELDAQDVGNAFEEAGTGNEDSVKL